MTSKSIEGGAVELPTRDVLITVHGTFAADQADRGTAWWQKDSHFVREPTHIAAMS